MFAAILFRHAFRSSKSQMLERRVWRDFAAVTCSVGYFGDGRGVGSWRWVWYWRPAPSGTRLLQLSE
jgi:hypothetical protein